MTPVAYLRLATRAALLVLGFVLGWNLRSCVLPSPVPAASPQRAPQATAAPVRAEQSASASVKAQAANSSGTKTTVRLTRIIPAQATQEGASASQVAQPGIGAPASASTGLVGGPGDGWVLEVVNEASSSSSAAATGGAEASGSVALACARNSSPEPGRLGVALLTVPGVVAVDLAVLRAVVPDWLLGQPVGVSLDIEANAEQFGLGVALGDKAFAAAGICTRWDMAQRGAYVGAGLRF